MVFSMPSFTSTTPLIFLILSPTFGAPLLQQIRVLRKQLDLDRLRRIWSDRRSCPAAPATNSTSSCGYFSFTLSRTSEMTSSMPRSRSRFSFTEKSPRLASVTAASPSCKPGAPRRAFHFRRRLQNLLDAQQHVVGIGQRRSRGHQVIENESAFVHRRQQIAAERADSRSTTRRSAPRIPPPATSG